MIVALTGSSVTQAGTVELDASPHDASKAAAVTVTGPTGRPVISKADGEPGSSANERSATRNPAILTRKQTTPAGTVESSMMAAPDSSAPVPCREQLETSSKNPQAMSQAAGFDNEIVLGGELVGTWGLITLAPRAPRELRDTLSPQVETVPARIPRRHQRSRGGTGR